MAKAKAGKPSASRKPGGELPYTSVEKAVGGPICGNPKPGLQPNKGVTGQPKLPPVKK